jgi:hypothetical protein
LSVLRGVGRIDLLQARREGIGDERDVARVGLDVRVARGVDVALGTVELRRHVELANEVGGGEVAGLPGLHLGVARLLQQHRQPADLELGAGARDEVGVACARDQARLGLDLVRVLQRARRDGDVDELAAELLRERAPLGLAREDAHGAVRGSERERKDRSDERGPAMKKRSRHGALSEESVRVRAVRAEAHLVLHEPLRVGAAFARAVARQLDAHARELARVEVEHQRVLARAIGRQRDQAVVRAVVGRARVEPFRSAGRRASAA